MCAYTYTLTHVHIPPSSLADTERTSTSDPTANSGLSPSTCKNPPPPAPRAPRAPLAPPAPLAREAKSGFTSSSSLPFRSPPRCPHTPPSPTLHSPSPLPFPSTARSTAQARASSEASRICNGSTCLKSFSYLSIQDLESSVLTCLPKKKYGKIPLCSCEI